VDVGAKRAIYDILTRLAAQGTAILLVSSENDELVALSHRVLVLRGGRAVAELSGQEITEENIMLAAFESKSETAV
jgi:simple sugar transport system ATP-binding protein/ribose transport system ATP-binding protein